MFPLTLPVVEPERLFELPLHLLLVLLDQEARRQNAKFLELKLAGTCSKITELWALIHRVVSQL